MVQSKTVTPRKAQTRTAGAPPASAKNDATVARSTADLLTKLRGSEPRFVARAPGRLDVAGGLAEYSGALVLNMPIGEQVCLALQRCDGDELSIFSTNAGPLDGAAPFVVPMSQLLADDGSPIDAAHGKQLASSPGQRTVRCVLGAIAESVRAGVVSRLTGGMAVAIALPLDPTHAMGVDAGISASVVTALAASESVEVSPADAANICLRVENDWLGFPAGIADAACVLTGRCDALCQVKCDPFSLGDPVSLPDGVSLIGIGCGLMHPEADERYHAVRTATFMGRLLVDRIVQHEGAPEKWDGYLSRVSVNDYIERFRDRLPTRLEGAEFLQRFGETGDPLTRIDPDVVYKVRSRTEHHIYENERSHQFVQCLARAVRSGKDRALHDAGELMRASHWSYGQRCGLGSVATDALVRLVRSHGKNAGVFGAKIAGRGCGGTVAVLMRGSDECEAALAAAFAEYQAKTGHTPTVFRSDCPGALVNGVERVES